MMELRKVHIAKLWIFSVVIIGLLRLLLKICWLNLRATGIKTLRNIANLTLRDRIRSSEIRRCSEIGTSDKT